MGTKIKLMDLLDHKNSLFQLSNTINWEKFENLILDKVTEGPGRPPISTRLIVGLHLLKYLENKSDEQIVAGFVQNPYWQYFCGCEYFEHKIPIHPTSMGKWRKKIGVDNFEKILEETLVIAKKVLMIKEKEFHITVQEKFITFPTDAKLYNKSRIKLVRLCKKRNLKLRQTYVRVGKKSLMMVWRYSHARQMKRSKKEIKKLRIYLGRVIRDIDSKIELVDDKLREALDLAKRIYLQEKHDKNKVYSVHATEVECIAKGKAHKRYEFGNKVSIVTTSKNNWIVSVESFYGNPYDGHTLKSSIEKMKSICKKNPEKIFVDAGYKGKENYPENIEVYVAQRKKKTTRKLFNLFKRRSAIEPVIGHLKSNYRMGKNFLSGIIGDKINSILSACAFNLKKILNGFDKKNKVTYALC